MDVIPKQVEVYETPEGRQPFNEWLDSLKNKRTVSIITKRLERVKLGNLGDIRSVGKGVYELKIDYGAGYRIYFGQIGNTIIILLSAGDKSTQDKDITQAQEYWENYRSEGNG